MTHESAVWQQNSGQVLEFIACIIALSFLRHFDVRENHHKAYWDVSTQTQQLIRCYYMFEIIFD